MTNQVSSPTMLPAVSPEPSVNYFPRYDNTPQLTSPRLSSPSTHPVEWPELAPPATTPTTVRSEPTVPPQPPAELAMTQTVAPSMTPPLQPVVSTQKHGSETTAAPSMTPPLQPVVSTQKHASETTAAPSMTQPHPVHSTPMPSGNGAPMPSGYGAPPFTGHMPTPSGYGAPPSPGHNGAPMPSGYGAPPFTVHMPTLSSYGAPPFSGHNMLTPRNGPSMHTGNAYNGAPTFPGSGYIGLYGTPMPPSSYYPPMHPNSTTMYNGSGYSYGSCVWNPPHNLPVHGYPPFAMSQPPVLPAPWSDNHHPNFAGWSNVSQSHPVHAPTPTVEHASTASPNARPSSPLRANAPIFTPTSPPVSSSAPVQERAQKGDRYLRAEEIQAVLDNNQYPSYLIHTVTAPAYCTNPDARDLTYHVGGKPTFDFCGLEPSKNPSPATRKRSVLHGALDSSTTAGTDLKLTQDTDFPAWLDQFTVDCRSYGLDTCLYINPHNRGMQLIGKCLPLCDNVIMAALGQHRRNHMLANPLYLAEERLIHEKLAKSISDIHLKNFYTMQANFVDELPTTPIIEVLYQLYIQCTGGTATYIEALKTKFNSLKISSSSGGLVGVLTQFTFLLARMEIFGHYPLHAITKLTQLARSAPPYKAFTYEVDKIEVKYTTIVPPTFQNDTFHQQVDFLKRTGSHPIQIARFLSTRYQIYSDRDNLQRATSHAEVHNPHQAHYTSAPSDTTSAALAAAEAAHQENIQRGKESKRHLLQLKQNHPASTTNNNNNRNSSSQPREPRGGNRGGKGRNGNRSSPHRHRPPRSESNDNTGDTAASTAHRSRSTQSGEPRTVSTGPPTLTANYVIDKPSADDDLPEVYIVSVGEGGTATDATSPTFTRFNVFTQSEVLSTTPEARVTPIPPNIDTALLVSGSEVEDVLPFIFDCGASVNIVPDASAFLPGTLRSPNRKIPVKGLASSCLVAGIGIIAVDFPAIDGSLRRFEMEAYHIPDSNVPRIISPQVYFDQQNARHNDEWPERVLLSGDAACFICHPTAPDLKFTRTRGSSGLYIGYGQFASSPATVCTAVTVPGNTNLTAAQQCLLSLHNRFGHSSMTALQKLLRDGSLSRTETERSQHLAAGTCPIPHCAACCLGKAKRRSVPGNTVSMDPTIDGSISENDLAPGSCISVDHIICSVKGRRYDTRSQAKEATMFSGTCLFIDHYSKAIFVHHQQQLTMYETLEAKYALEHWMASHNIMARAYRTDNARVFTNNEFTISLSGQRQFSRQAGVGAHHQNGIAERAIQTITFSARTLMIHAALHWPRLEDNTLWPMAIDAAVRSYNHLPRPGINLSPLAIFTRAHLRVTQLYDLHVWGCPTYVLDPRLQDGKKIPRWEPRSRLGVYMGTSQQHASNVPLILNLSTNSISPQFHCVFDDHFTTIPNIPDLDSPIWLPLLNDENYTYEYPFELEIDDTNQPPSPPREPPSPQREPPSPQREPPSPQREPPSPQRELLSLQREPPSSQRETPSPSGSNALRRSTRSNKGSRSTPYFRDEQATHFTVLLAHPGVPSPPHPTHIAAYVAAASDPDTLRYAEAMRSYDADGFREAMRQEIAELEDLGTWTLVARSEAAHTKIIPGTWTFKRKRHPDGRVKKLKARFCVRGDLQPDLPDTYSPVAPWSTIRLLLLISLHLGWATRCIDFSNAFVQAPLDTPIYVHIPQGFSPCSGTHQEYCLRLHKSLYGIAQAPKLWFEHLTAAFKRHGFKQSAHDPCLLYATNTILVIYVDDVLLISRDDSLLDKLIAALLQDNFKLTQDGNLCEYLGIDIQPIPTSSACSRPAMELSQSGLISRILKATGLEHCNPRACPAESTPLATFPDSPAHDSPWRYSSVVGMLLYLANNTRPDISFAVAQAARFTHHPKHEHTMAITRIVRYLKGTSSRGIILQPSNVLTVNCYVDADFAGLWASEDPNDPVSTKSRTGYAIDFGNCPLIWSSKLQTTISLSTTEAEYVALSTALRAFLPLKALIHELASAAGLKARIPFTTRSTIFEDNEACIAIAKAPRMTPRSKHFAIQYHWWRGHVEMGSTDIQSIPTDIQRADLLTKGLPKARFQELRTLLMGW